MQEKTKKIANKKADTSTRKTTAKVTNSSRVTAKRTAAISKGVVSKQTITTSKSSSVKADTKISTKKAVSRNTPKTASKKVVTPAKTKKIEVVEYYDLPYRYNQTIVRILAQTPDTLFVYWDISDTDREKYIAEFGQDFFNSTIPVLIVHNKTMNYSFEIEINDFANSWYFNVNDTKCDYEVELGRRAKPATIDLPNNYMYVTSSNVVELPNNHILFEKNQNTLFFRNVKTNATFSKPTSQLHFMQYAGRIHNVSDIYKKIYKNEEWQELDKNPSSNFNKGAF